MLHGGLTEDHVHDAVRIAATIHGVAVALDALPPASEEQLARAAE